MKTKYKTLYEWKKEHPKAFNQAYKKGYIKEICETFGFPLPKKRNLLIKWTKEKCLKEAKKYKGRKELKTGNHSCWKFAKQNNLLQLCYPKNEWSLKKCLIESKKYKFKAEWEKNEPTSFFWAKHRKEIFEKCCEHMSSPCKSVGYWTKERCIESAKNFNSKVEWEKKFASAINKARRNGWLDDCCAHMTGCKTRWTIEKCLEEGKKYKTAKEWKNASPGSYKFACKHNLVEEIPTIPRKKTLIDWTKEKCLEEALKYKTITEWGRNSYSCTVAREKGWFDECSKHMKRGCKPMGYWTKKRCIEEAVKYNSSGEWKSNSASSYATAYKNKWLSEIRALFKI